MISLAENNALPYIQKASFMQTACLLKAFKGSALCPDVWVQRVDGRTSAVISRFGGRLYITAEDTDFEEIKEFINVLGFSEIFTERQTAEKLGLAFSGDFCVLKKQAKKQKDFCAIPPLKDLYCALSVGTDEDISLPCFESFAADVSHRLRHGAGVAILEDFGAALAFCCDYGAVINGIAVNKASRSKGLGSKLLKDICEYSDGDVFALANQNTANFYIKNGFKVCDTAVIIRG